MFNENCSRDCYCGRQYTDKCRLTQESYNFIEEVTGHTPCFWCSSDRLEKGDEGYEEEKDYEEFYNKIRYEFKRNLDDLCEDFSKLLIDREEFVCKFERTVLRIDIIEGEVDKSEVFLF